MLLRHLQHENVIGLKELLLPSGSDFKDLYLVQDLMDTDLHQIIRSSQALSNEHLQYFIYQVGYRPTSSPRGKRVGGSKVYAIHVLGNCPPLI